MKYGSLAFAGLLLFSTAACTKTKPVAATRPADTTPVTSAPATQPPQQRDSTRPTEAPQQTARDTGPGRQMPPEVRRTLNERLAHLSDALFDYDKATIRDHARRAPDED